jgi:hypothetical protein
MSTQLFDLFAHKVDKFDGATQVNLLQTIDVLCDPCGNLSGITPHRKIFKTFRYQGIPVDYFYPVHYQHKQYWINGRPSKGATVISSL